MEKARKGEFVLGMHCSSLNQQVVEVIGMAGADFTIIGMEMEQTDLSQLENLVRVADSAGIPSMVKIRRNDPLLAIDAFNAGAHFVMAPHQLNADHVEAMIKASRFAPEGLRGLCPVARYVRYGVDRSNKAIEGTHAYPMIIPIIEDKEAIDNIDDILEVDGLGIIEIGPWDLSQSLGCKNPDMSYGNKETWEAIEIVAAKCKEKKLPLLGPFWQPQEFSSIQELINFQRDKLMPLGFTAFYDGDLFSVGRYLGRLNRARMNLNR
jgi:4-hydroxy-2-oxoheptanedioate aldolase